MTVTNRDGNRPGTAVQSRKKVCGEFEWQIFAEYAAGNWTRKTTHSPSIEHGKKSEENLDLDSLDGKFIDGLDLCRQVYRLFEQVWEGEDGTRKLRERKRPEKRLLEELLPICRYVQVFYGPGLYLSICWLTGKQYDAKVEASGGVVEAGGCPPTGTLEVTQAVHRNEYLMRERLQTAGHAFGLSGLSRAVGVDGTKLVESIPTSFSNQSYIDEFAVIMLNAINAKIAKAYPDDTTLIVDCTLNTIYGKLEWEELIRRVRESLPSHNFVRVFACAGAGGYTADI